MKEVFNKVREVNPKGWLNIHELIDGIYYGTYYNSVKDYFDVKCINKKWYDSDNNFIRDWNDKDQHDSVDI